jgi:hypothetical protein
MTMKGRIARGKLTAMCVALVAWGVCALWHPGNAAGDATGKTMIVLGSPADDAMPTR